MKKEKSSLKNKFKKQSYAMGGQAWSAIGQGAPQMLDSLISLIENSGQKQLDQPIVNASTIRGMSTPYSRFAYGGDLGGIEGIDIAEIQAMADEYGMSIEELIQAIQEGETPESMDAPPVEEEEDFEPVAEAEGADEVTPMQEVSGQMDEVEDEAKGIMDYMESAGQYAYGGRAGGGGRKNINVEDNELLEMPNGEIKRARGKGHEDGGIDVNVPDGTKIFSDRLMLDGRTMQQRKLTRERQLTKFEKLLEKNPYDKLLKRTYERSSLGFQKEEEGDMQLQEVANLLYNRRTRPRYAYGGVPGYILPKARSSYGNSYETISGGAFIGSDFDALENHVFDNIEPWKDWLYGPNHRSGPPGSPAGGMSGIAGMNSIAPMANAIDQRAISGTGASTAGDMFGLTVPVNTSDVPTGGVSTGNVTIDDPAFNYKPKGLSRQTSGGAYNPILNPNLDSPFTAEFKPGGAMSDSLQYQAEGLPIADNPISATAGPIANSGTAMTQGGLTPGDWVGMAGTAFGSIAPMINTLLQRRSDRPNVNRFRGFGRDAIMANEDAQDFASGMRSTQLTDIDTSAGSQRYRNRNSAQGVNTLRALDAVTTMGADKAKAGANNSFANQMMMLMGQRGQLTNARDMAEMRGETMRDMEDKADKDAFFTAGAQNIAGMAQGVETIGRNLNISRGNQQDRKMLSQLSRYGLTFDDYGNLIST